MQHMMKVAKTMCRQDVLEMEDGANAAGYEVNYELNKTGNKIVAVTALYKAWSKLGYDTYVEMLKTIKSAWGFDRYAVSANMINGMTKVYILYGKQFKSINDKDLGIETEEEKSDIAEKQEENQVMLDYLRDCLDGKVSAVRLSNKLKSHPVCLTTDGEVSLEMEKYFATIPGDHPDIKAQRVLEINPTHKAFYMLLDMWQLDKDRCAKLGKLLYNQALLIADISIENPSEYTDLFWELI